MSVKCDFCEVEGWLPLSNVPTIVNVIEVGQKERA